MRGHAELADGVHQCGAADRLPRCRSVPTTSRSAAALCWRTAPNLASVGRLAALGAGTPALAHGRPVTDDVAGRLSQLIADS
ncbi:MAG: hypothetical protein EA340_12840 [Nitriliruptor sp.]|nr:MAG: hypothetical protein EA340_12840 [Nitriliruptor sp.]